METGPSGTIRVGAVDDHPVMIEGLAGLLDQTEGLDFVGGWPSVEEMPDDVRADVVLLDLQLAGGTRPRDNVRKLRDLGAQVVVYTDGARRAWMADALFGGALGVVLKRQGKSDLVDAVRTAAAGELSLSPELARALHDSALLRPQLAAREVEVLVLAAEGLAGKQVATQLGITEGTVKTYLKRIRTKYADLGRHAGTRIELRARAIEDGHVLSDGASA